jgi:hypothetical protein
LCSGAAANDGQPRPLSEQLFGPQTAPAAAQTAPRYGEADVAAIVDASRNNEIRFNRDYANRQFDTTRRFAGAHEAAFGISGEYRIVFKRPGSGDVNCYVPTWADPAVRLFVRRLPGARRIMTEITRERPAPLPAPPRTLPVEKPSESRPHDPWPKGPSPAPRPAWWTIALVLFGLAMSIAWAGVLAWIMFHSIGTAFAHFIG